MKVLDFGVAKLCHDVDELDFGVTRPGMVVGTPTYMSPEQASGKHIDARSDIHAVGAVLYQLLSGRPPFEAHSLGQLIVNIVTQPPRPLLAVTPQREPIPAVLRALVLRCLEKEPHARFESMEALRAALLDSVREDSVDVSTDFTEAFVPAPRRAWKAWAAFSLGAALLGGGAFAVARLRTHPPERVVGTAAPLLSPPLALPTSVQIAITSRPAGAHVSLTETHEDLGVTPLSITLPRAEGNVALGLSVTGYRPELRTVRLDQNATLEVVLSPIPGKKATLKRVLSKFRAH